nr:pleckstrin homology domain-containing family G member 2 isoform X1 [Geotrypetes seraphini]
MNYPNSVSVLHDCMKSEVLAKFFRERQAMLSHSLPLETYLLKPVQRILKYHLLLQELAKHFDKNSHGYETVEEAIITMTAVAWYINDMKRKQEHAIRLQEIQSLLVSWKGPDLSAFGELVLEGMLRVQRVKKERAFFLFSKMLLIAKKRGDQFVYKTHIFCCNLALTEHMKDSLSFKVADLTIPKQQQVVQAKNQEEKRLWIHYLKRLIVENHPASIPQKAKQVLLENSFQYSPEVRLSPESLWKSVSSPWSADTRGYPIIRRQSEPPQFIYSPERGRKSLSICSLDNSVQYRRGRRQSEPAQEIPMTFTGASIAKLKHAGSEGELFPTSESIKSSGTTCTVASSVIEVDTTGDAEESDPTEEPTFSLGDEPLSTSFSITEEILELLNQKGLKGATGEAERSLGEEKQDISTATETKQDLLVSQTFHKDLERFGELRALQEETEDTLSDTIPSSGNYYVPIPGNESLENPIANVSTGYHASVSESSEEEELKQENGASPLHVLEDLGEDDAPALSTESEELAEHSIEENVQEDLKQQLDNGSHVNKSDCIHFAEDHLQVIGGELKVNSPTIPCSQNLSSWSGGDEEPLCSSVDKCERTASLKRDSALTQDDRLLIEKIKNYYEATETNSFYLNRRESVSYIPTGVVKDSILRFNYILQQESKKDQCQQGEGCCLSLAVTSQPSRVFLPNNVEQELDNGSDGKCHRSQEPKCDSDYSSCSEIRKAWKDKEKRNTNIPKLSGALKRGKKNKKALDVHQENPFNETLVIVEESDLDATTPITKETSSEAKAEEESPINRKAHKLDSLLDPSHGLSSGEPSRDILSRNPTYCASTGLPDLNFPMEGSGCLIENSEKIISKVQLLAQMYSEKICRMKAPRRAGDSRSQAIKVKGGVGSLPKLPEEKLPDSSTAGEPQVYGHVLIHEALMHLNCYQESSIIISAAKENISGLERHRLAPPPDSRLLETSISPDDSEDFSEGEVRSDQPDLVSYKSAEPAVASSGEKSISPTASTSELVVDKYPAPTVSEEIESAAPLISNIIPLKSPMVQSLHRVCAPEGGDASEVEVRRNEKPPDPIDYTIPLIHCPDPVNNKGSHHSQETHLVDYPLPTSREPNEVGPKSNKMDPKSLAEGPSENSNVSRSCKQPVDFCSDGISEECKFESTSLTLTQLTQSASPALISPPEDSPPNMFSTSIVCANTLGKISALRDFLETEPTVRTRDIDGGGTAQVSEINTPVTFLIPASALSSDVKECPVAVEAKLPFKQKMSMSKSPSTVYAKPASSTNENDVCMITLTELSPEEDVNVKYPPLSCRNARPSSQETPSSDIHSSPQSPGFQQHFSCSTESGSPYSQQHKEVKEPSMARSEDASRLQLETTLATAAASRGKLCCPEPQRADLPSRTSSFWRTGRSFQRSCSSPVNPVVTVCSKQDPQPTSSSPGVKHLPLSPIQRRLSSAAAISKYLAASCSSQGGMKPLILPNSKSLDIDIQPQLAQSPVEQPLPSPSVHLGSPLPALGHRNEANPVRPSANASVQLPKKTSMSPIATGDEEKKRETVSALHNSAKTFISGYKPSFSLPLSFSPRNSPGILSPVAAAPSDQEVHIALSSDGGSPEESIHFPSASVVIAFPRLPVDKPSGVHAKSQPGLSATVSAPNSRVQSPTPQCTRISSPPPVFRRLPGKSPHPSFMKSSACPFTPLCINSQEFPSSCSSNSTPTCRSPEIASPPSSTSGPQVGLASLPQKGRGFQGSRLSSASPTQRSGSPVHPACLSPSARDEDPSFWSNVGSALQSPGVHSPVGVESSVLSSPELTRINWPHVRDLRSKYVALENDDGLDLQRKAEQKQITSPVPSRALHDGSWGLGQMEESSATGHALAPDGIKDVVECQTAVSENPDKSPFKTSYSTTVNIQIGGSGRIASFNNAQVSLTHPFLTAPESQSMRKICINGSTLESPPKT